MGREKEEGESERRGEKKIESVRRGEREKGESERRGERGRGE